MLVSSRALLRYNAGVLLPLRRRLLASFLFIALVPAALIAYYYHRQTQRLVTESYAAGNRRITASIAESMQEQVRQAEQITVWVNLDEDILRLLAAPPARRPPGHTLELAAMRRVDQLFQLTPVAQHVLSFLLASRWGVELRGGQEGFLVELSDLAGRDWVRQAEQAPGRLSWGLLERNPAAVSAVPRVIPLCRTIVALDSGERIGTIILLFAPSLLGSSYRGVEVAPDESIQVTRKEGGLIFAGGSPDAAAGRDARDSVIVEHTMVDSGWVVRRSSPIAGLRGRRALATRTALMLVAVAAFASWWFALYLSANFARPIRTLARSVEKIAEGHFDHSIVVTKRDEIGDLARHISLMSGRLEKLLAERVQEEREKRRVEIQLLRSQINPHFLHNTLASIRWMATFQGASGIVDMVTRLGRLLQAAMGGLDERGTLREEIAILEDYLRIQQVRYRDRLRYAFDVEGEELLECRVPRFVLQPIVENAILHGIEPRAEGGEVRLSAAAVAGDLRITITDNGVGMNPERLTAACGIPTEGIGLNNVRRRLHYEYGDRCALQIHSEQGRFTRVELRIPMEPARAEAAP